MSVPKSEKPLQTSSWSTVPSQHRDFEEWWATMGTSLPDDRRSTLSHREVAYSWARTAWAELKSRG